jgi:glutamine amidotransferase
VHSYAATTWLLDDSGSLPSPLVSYATHGQKFVAAVENGPLSATQFHPEKSGEAGLALLRNWVRSLV